MSFWKHLKPASPPPVATSVDMRGDEKAIQLTWNDGATTRVGARVLRQQCPCAGCVDEFSGKRTLDQDAVPLDISIVEMGPVGNYALMFTFSDAHNTGIFTWEKLRTLSETFAEPRVT